MAINVGLPFIFLADVILLGEVNQICDRFCCKKGEAVYDVDLRRMVRLAFQSFQKG
jgi:hypothetical protein